MDKCTLIGKGGKVMNKTYDDSNWREEYKAYTSSKKDLEMLENGPKSLSQSWYMSTLYQKWKKMKKISSVISTSAGSYQMSLI